MATDIIVEHFRKIALFQGLSPLQITEIARRAQRIVYQPGQTIIAENEQSAAAILIISGVAIRVSGPQTKPEGDRLSPGALIGEMAMLIETQHSSTIIAHSQVRALHIYRTDLIEQMQEDPRIADHFVSILTGRLSSIAGELQNIEMSLSRYTPPNANMPNVHIH